MLRQETKFDFQIRDLMRDAVRHYLQFHNKPATVPFDEWGTLDFIAFHAPVCIFPNGKQDDITAGRLRWNNAEFPAICGDFRGDETVDFMKAAGLPVGSPHLGKAFREDVVPRVRIFPFSFVSLLADKLSCSNFNTSIFLQFQLILDYVN